MKEERDPDDIIRGMRRFLERVRNGTIELDETDQIAERHREVIERRATSNSTEEGETQ